MPCNMTWSLFGREEAGGGGGGGWGEWFEYHGHCSDESDY